MPIEEIGYDTNGEDWASRAQLWMFDLFDLVWGLRNADDHGVDPETQRMVCKARCERAVHRLFSLGDKLPHHELHPFRDPIDTLLSKSVSAQELWISKTEEFLPLARKRVKRLANKGQHSMTEFCTNECSIGLFHLISIGWRRLFEHDATQVGDGLG
jgi:hypothetical protein